ncbi:hypothetical protein [Pseudonocardia sp. KRD291]|uniref:hypothetical protein n=1 Tax=Pseudonocardia sp. KRD291 TaxID=2792007 RepID=UPI001C4A3BE4|nr:hypothetical protein [Pseudonocardia sp. KRD291]MBW0106033.1 hypothetical protein [Pseudonocardia sp. KRD291]
MAKDARDYQDDYTDPRLRERLKEEIKQSDKGGAPGKWSARKSQLLTQEYEKQGGGYRHPDQPTDAQRSLEQWTDEKWQTADGSAGARGADGTDRYLPEKAWEQMSDDEKAETRRRKRAGSKKGRGDVPNTDAAKKTRKGAQLDEMNADDAVKEARKLSPSTAEKALEHERANRGRKTVEQQLGKSARRD